MPVDSKANQVAGPQRSVTVDTPLLGHVADIRVAAVCRVAVDFNGSLIQPVLAEQCFQQRSFARAVGSEHGNELTGLNINGQVVPQHPFAEAKLAVCNRQCGTVNGGTRPFEG